ncbi:hypothetical protein BJ138DRAFT_1103189 [Hygrophoropsis aurantiaca]|uniref:Uncharacterized protein n=1 Tax=Hygrophoropsis aurantiaca TaxID=72124 RepID=A0ACB8A803_9AGAM|nr:hypothetical protein BJ138DRAFT_1103189 [Hygrophoropsis aurantiaca]
MSSRVLRIINIPSLRNDWLAPMPLRLKWYQWRERQPLIIGRMDVCPATGILNFSNHPRIAWNIQPSNSRRSWMLALLVSCPSPGLRGQAWKWSMACELGGEKMEINTISQFTSTPTYVDKFPHLFEKLFGMNALGKLGRPDDAGCGDSTYSLQVATIRVKGVE